MTIKSLFAPLERWLFRYMVAVGAVARCSDAPDTTGLQQAALKSADLGESALKWWQDVYRDQAPARERASQLAEKVAGAQLTSMDTQTRIANETDAYNRGTFRPLEQQIVQEARNFDTEAEREKLAGKALGDVRQSFAAARDIGIRDLTRRGVNPNDGNYGSVAKQLALGEAAAGAGAATKAREDAITLGRALKMDAVSTGRGLPGQQATATSLALNSGNSAVNNGQVPLQIANQGAQQVGQGYQQAMQGNQISGNMYGQIASLEKSSDGDMLGGLANLGMAGKYIFSDKKMKKDRKRMSGDEAITLARKMPVDKWKYRDGSPADDGGQEHIGPMAQDAHAAGGESLAPGGNKIDLISMNGITLAAVQELDKKVARLEKHLA